MGLRPTYNSSILFKLEVQASSLARCIALLVLELLFVSQRVRPELLGLLLRPLLAHILSDHEAILAGGHCFALRNPWVIGVDVRVLGHVEYWGRFAGVIDDVVVDVVVVDDVCDIAATLRLAFDPLLRWV